MFKELPMIEKRKLHIGCLTCSTASYVLSMDRELAVGFGDVTATKDGQVLYSEMEFTRKNPDCKEYPTTQYIENMAIKDPDHDWRIEFFGPMHGETYQRHLDGKWVCIESTNGFA